MPDTVSGAATAFFLYDVGDEIELAHVRTLIATTAPAALTTKVTASSVTRPRATFLLEDYLVLRPIWSSPPGAPR